MSITHCCEYNISQISRHLNAHTFMQQMCLLSLIIIIETSMTNWVKILTDLFCSCLDTPSQKTDIRQSATVFRNVSHWVAGLYLFLLMSLQRSLHGHQHINTNEKIDDLCNGFVKAIGHCRLTVLSKAHTSCITTAI